jgi:hypothetical protein
MTLSISWATESNVFDGTGVAVNETTFHFLEFDAVMSENHETRAEITEHAVESGAPLADHKRAKPRVITLEGLVTNTPLDVPPPSGFGQVNVTVTTSKDGAQVKTFSEEFDRVRDVWDSLDRLVLSDIPVSVSTEFKDYEDCQIIAMTAPRSTPDDAIVFTVEISEVRIAVSREVDTPAPREPRGETEEDRGAREGEDTPRLRSTLDAIGEAGAEYAADLVSFL